MASGSAEEVLYKELKYRPVSPLEHDLQCLDICVRVEEKLLQKVKSKMFGNMRPLMRLGSMFNDDLMEATSNWRSEDADLRPMREGLADLRNFMISRPSHEHFQKKPLRRYNFSCSASKGGVLWLSGIAGIELGHEESLSCSMDGLTASFVDFLTVCKWIKSGDWRPNIPLFREITSDWSRDHRNQVRKLWIVTEVLYATKFTVTGRSGLVGKVMAQDPLSRAGLDVGICRVNDTTLELKAKRNKHFIVGFRTMRVEYNPDGTPVLFRKAEDSGLRGDDDDPHELNLVSMGEDIFEVDQDGDKVSIPLLTPTDQDLNELRSLVANSRVADPGSPSVH